MKLPSLLILLLFSIFFIQCQTDELVHIQDNYPGVDSRLYKYFQEFEHQGSLRGLNIDLVSHGITGEIIDLPGLYVAGRCQYGSHQLPQVYLDEDFWDRASDLMREMVVFHELGHCFLRRDHLEGTFDDGTCISIMRSGDGSCFDNYNLHSRAYYLDELFLNL